MAGLMSTSSLINWAAYQVGHANFVTCSNCELSIIRNTFSNRDSAQTHTVLMNKSDERIKHKEETYKSGILDLFVKVTFQLIQCFNHWTGAYKYMQIKSNSLSVYKNQSFSLPKHRSKRVLTFTWWTSAAYYWYGLIQWYIIRVKIFSMFIYVWCVYLASVKSCVFRLFHYL